MFKLCPNIQERKNNSDETENNELSIFDFFSFVFAKITRLP